MVSLIMPVWRPRADWLLAAVRNALGQSSCAIELLLVDDGSPTPVAELVAEIDDPRLRLIRIEHSGVERARNVGVAEARGDYLRFVDGDDLIEPDSTATLLHICEGRDDVIAHGATLFCDDDLRPLWTMVSKVEGDGTEACLLGRLTVRITAMLFPARVIELAGEFEELLPSAPSSDWDFVLRCLEHGRLRRSETVAALYRRHTTGNTANAAGGVAAAERVVERYFERHPEQRGTRLERRARARMLAHTGRIYATHGEPGRAVARLAGAARLAPAAIGVEVAQARPALIAAARERLRPL